MKKTSLLALHPFFTLEKQGVAISPFWNNEIATSPPDVWRVLVHKQGTVPSYKIYKDGDAMTSLSLAVMAFVGALFLTACSKTSVTTAQNTGPDNALTRYAENLANDEARAKGAADKANAVISRTQEQVKDAANQPQ